jgi:hypothetical protein
MYWVAIQSLLQCSFIRAAQFLDTRRNDNLIVIITGRHRDLNSIAAGLPKYVREYSKLLRYLLDSRKLRGVAAYDNSSGIFAKKQKFKRQFAFCQPNRASGFGG